MVKRTKLPDVKIVGDDGPDGATGSLVTFTDASGKSKIISGEASYEPTAGEIAVLKAIAKKMQKLGLESDYVIAPENKSALDSPFGGVVYQDKKYTVVKPEAALGFIAERIELEGILRHESGHIERNYGIALPKRQLDKVFHPVVNVASNQFNTLLGQLSDDTLSDDKRHKVGVELQGRIASTIEQFGSIESFQKALADVEARITPVIDTLKSRPEIFSASPETLALLMENNDHDISWVKTELEKLPFKDIAKFSQKLRESEKNQLEGIREQSENEPLPPTDTIYAIASQLTSISNLRRSLQQLGINLIKAEEYTVDGDAVRNSPNPQASMQGLYNLFKSVFDGDAKLMATDDPEHPSPNKRLARMQFIVEHERSPSEAEMSQLMKNMEKEAEPAIAESIKLAPGDEIEKPVTLPITGGNRGKTR